MFSIPGVHCSSRETLQNASLSLWPAATLPPPLFPPLPISWFPVRNMCKISAGWATAELLHQTGLQGQQEGMSVGGIKK